ncbi:MAG: PLP-dependent aminotransferase family protein, partial [Spirochaetes bacterium]
MPRIAPYLSVGTINLDRSAPIPLHRQLYRALREKILTNVILPGERLPSSRVLAEELHLGRNTVVNAYNQLIAEGFLDSTVGSGTIVSSDLPEELTGTVASSDNLDDLSRGPGERDIRISERGIALSDVPFLEETRLKPFTPA